MSNSTPPQPRLAKTMSSRLMTMKFMQRAAASTPPSTPHSQSRNTDTPPSKRRKASDTPSSAAAPSTESQLLQVALEEEEGKREKAIARLAEEAGETKWVLSIADGRPGEGKTGLRVATAGYSDIDQEAWRPAVVGRWSFGKFNRDLEKRQNSTADETSSSTEEDSKEKHGEDSDESDDPTGTRDSIQASNKGAMERANADRFERKKQRRAEKAESARLAEKRRSKEVKLNNLSSISGGGGNGAKPGNRNGDRECHICGAKGHEKRDCPQKGKRKNEDGLGGYSKRSRPSLDC